MLFITTCSLAGVLLLLLILQSTDYLPYKALCRQCYNDGRKEKTFWAIMFPGETTSFHPEHIIELKDWVGSKFDGLRGVNSDTNKEVPEVTASIALKAIGIANPSYQLEQKLDGHYILKSPESTTRYFSWHAHRQVTKCSIGHNNYPYLLSI